MPCAVAHVAGAPYDFTAAGGGGKLSFAPRNIVVEYECVCFGDELKVKGPS